MSEAKPFCISKWEVWKAYKRVKANQGAAGVDEQSIADFEKKLKGNLYKIWNRMSSGSYFPPPVRTVKIPKANGGERKLGIPTVSDRIAQMVVKSRLEPAVEPLFHPDSYGYRPGKSAWDAVGKARQRCWRQDWIVDLDIKGFFDNIDQDLLMRAVRKHAKDKWVVLYIERWLQAPMQEENGRLVPREKGTPQGGVISPLLANLFLHYAFDRWLTKRYPQLSFERYADDAIVHCRTERQAQEVRAAIAARLRDCGLELHPEKTKIVYCKDEDRRRTYPNEKFDFLGYTFRPRRSKNRFEKYFINFSPAVSDKAVAGDGVAPSSRRFGAGAAALTQGLTKARSSKDLSRMFIRVSDKRRFGAGSCTYAVTKASRICHGCSTRRSGAGFSITGGIIARRCIRQCANWIGRWPAGPIGNTRSCAAICAGRCTGLRAFPGVTQDCLRTGRWAYGVAPWREPYERRRSRTVLRERRGETPRRYSPQPLRAVPAGGRAGHGERDQLPRPAAEADGERSQERGGPPVGAGLPGLQLHGRTNAPAGYLAEGARPVQAAGSGTDAPHDERQIHPSRGGAVPLPRRVAGLLRILRGPLCPAPPRPVDTAAASRRRLEALEVWAYPLRGAAPPRGQQDPGGQDREQRPWPVAGQSQPGALHRAAQRFLRPARPRIRRRRPCRLTPSNRRVRTRTHGGVGGEEPRGSPLSRLRYGPASLRIGPEQSRARSGPLTARTDPGSSRERGKGDTRTRVFNRQAIAVYLRVSTSRQDPRSPRQPLWEVPLRLG